MTTIDSLRRDNASALEAAAQRRKRVHNEAAQILGLAERDGRANLTAAEDARLSRLRAQRERADDELIGLRAQRREIDAAIDEEVQLAAQCRDVRSTGAQLPQQHRGYDMQGRVGAEARTYSPGTDRDGKQFLLDAARGFMFNDRDSNGRLERHMAEERVERGQYLQRATGTGAYSGLVVPQYLTDLYAPATATLRPFANICNRHRLPADGMTVNISRITTATGVALQASENSAVQETNMDDTLLTENVQTFAGQQTISRQAIERGTGVEDVTVSDLLARLASSLDSTLINQATTGALATAASVTYTDASPTGPELWPSFFKAQSNLESALLGMAVPDFVVMHSRRWNWLCGELTTSWPMVGGTSAAPQNAAINLSNDYATTGVRGRLANGLGVIVDNNIPITVNTDQDVVMMVASRECHLWEDPAQPVLLRAEQAAASSLGVLLVCYQYAAYSFRRYGSNPVKITGTGLAAPAGY
jgi:hypothetical protein